MLKKLQTPLRNFRFNSITRKESLLVEWFRYGLDESIEEHISGFTDDELKLFEHFTVSKPFNFDGPKNYFIVKEDDLPVEIAWDLIPDSSITFPEYFILKPGYEIERGSKVSNKMPIALLDDRGAIHHDYHLPFGAIGKLIAL